MKLEDYSKYYIQGSDHYLVPKEIFIELFNEMINWKQKNAELKEQLEDMTDCRDIASGHRKEVQDRKTRLLKQQQKFINYLTSYIELLNNKPDLIEESQIDILKEILQKHKLIIGETNDKK